MHGTAWRLGQRLGHAHRDQPMTHRDLPQQMLEQEGLVGHLQGVAMQQVDLELAGAHLVQKGVAWQPEGAHGRIHLVEIGLLAVIGTHAEGRRRAGGAAVQAARGHERLQRIGIGLEQEELQLAGHHRTQALGGVVVQHTAQQAAGGQWTGRAAHLHGVADHQGARLFGPRQAVQLARIGRQHHVAVIAAVVARRRIAAHHALEQHPARHLQAPAFQEALGGHDLAARNAVEIRGNAFHRLDTRQARVLGNGQGGRHWEHLVWRQSAMGSP